MRTHYCGELNESHIDQTVSLCGWVHRRRDHGGVIFLDLRDRDGITQIVFDPDTVESFATAEQVRNEFVVKVVGRVRARPEGTVNSEMSTGQIEVLGKELEILNAADTPPFQLDEHMGVSEDVRLRNRFIDLRRPEMLNRMKMRSQITSSIRRYLDEGGFLDIETPILTRATPEGARDYLVPSRTHPGKFFALPQSPQLFKQLLMVSGIDRYYQIAKCFRDEDLRADRQPEFTQIDMETSFMDEDEVMAISETMIREVFTKHLGVELAEFPRMTHEEAVRKYGIDRPDLRISMQLVDIADLMKEVEFKVFNAPANDPASRVVVLKVDGGATLSRKQIDEYTSKNIIVSSSTSGLIMSDMQDRLENANRFVVGHPFNPPHLIPLVEVLGGKNTDVLAVDWAINFYNKIGKHAIKLKKEVPGHLANRLQAALWREAVLAVQNDLASVEDINAAVAMGPGLRWALMGPHMIMNLTGGAGGYRKMLDHFGPGISGWWETMNENPQLSTVLKKELINGIEEEAKGRSVSQLEEERDEQLVELLIMLKRLKKTGH